MAKKSGRKGGAAARKKPAKRAAAKAPKKAAKAGAPKKTAKAGAPKKAAKAGAPKKAAKAGAPKKAAKAGAPKKATPKQATGAGRMSPAAAPKSAALAKAPKAAAKKAAPRTSDAESLEMRVVLPASPERVLSAWLDSAEHSAFTGSDAAIDAKVGGKHSAWNGYIEGEILEIQDGRRVVMSWRTTEFDPEHPDSLLVVEAHPHPEGTELRLVHTELPAGGAAKYGQGWEDFYFAPMTKYFGN